MKKTLLVLSIFLLCLFSVGCNNTISNTDSPPPSNNDIPSHTVPNESQNTDNNTGKEENSISYSKGLEYSLSDDRTYLAVKSIGTCKDQKIVIPPVYNGLPVKAIGARAFVLGWHGDSNQIREVVFPDSIAEIGEDAFANNAYLKKITFGNSRIQIKSGAFYLCDGLKEIDFGRSVVTIEYSPFLYCDKIERIYISDLSKWCESDWINLSYNVHPELYLNGVLVTDLIIPEDIVTVKNSFKGFRNIQRVKIGNSVKSIAAEAFEACPDLVEVEISNSVSFIGSSAFHCDLLMRVTFADTSGWCAKKNYGEDEPILLQSEDLETPTVAASFLADSDNFAFYNWEKEGQ